MLNKDKLPTVWPARQSTEFDEKPFTSKVGSISNPTFSQMN